MPKQHIVEQGEYLSLIAAKYGFSSYKTIWDHAENAELKKKRKNPNILYPGDKLFIPDKDEKTEQAPTGQKHKYEAKSDALKLRLVVKDADGYPVASEPCQLEIGAKEYKKTTGGDGLVEEKMEGSPDSARLAVRDFEIPMKIGHLDPVEEISGQQARLHNLGYDPGPLDGSDEYKRQSAIEEFQCDNKLKVDGICGDKTQAKLVVVHGC